MNTLEQTPEPILVQIAKLPGVLAVGLPVRGPTSPTLGVVVIAGAAYPRVWWADTGGAPTGERPSYLHLDLRDPAVRDAVCRWMWACLRLGDPEPLTAPAFTWYAPGNGPGLGESVGWWSLAGEHMPPVPALASIPLDSPDRDLLAMQACALAVGSMVTP